MPSSATMPDAAPVEDLLVRLEEMERRLAGGGGGEPSGGRGPEARGAPTAGARASAAAPSHPMTTASAVGTVAHDVAASRPSAVSPASCADGWANFVAAARAKGSLRLSQFVAGSRVLEESAERLHIGVANELAVETLRAEMAMLAELATAAYGGPRRIELSVARAEGAAAAAPVSAATRTRELAERARSSPTVRSAVEVLGGEITDVRPRSRGGEP